MSFDMTDGQRKTWLERMDNDYRERLIEHGRQAWDMRVAGFRWTDIYKSMASVAVGNVSTYIEAAVSAFDYTRETDSPEVLHRLELDRLDRLSVALDREIAYGDYRAVTAALKVSESRRKLLGMDKPEKQEIVTREETSETDREIRALIDAMDMIDEAEEEAMIAGLSEDNDD